MAAFVSLVRAYAVWIYLLLVLGIFFGIKMLVDARQLSRTTLFSLDQERATEQVYRALILIGVAVTVMLVVTGIVFLIAPFAPSQESPILRGPTATLPALVFPTSTLIPTATATLSPPTETPFFTATPVVATATRTAIKPTAPPVVAATLTPAYPLPAPLITGPLPNGGTWIGEGRAVNDLKFQWAWNCDACKLGSDERFVVTISFIDKTLGAPRWIGGSTQNNYLSMAEIVRGYGGDVWHQAKEDTYQWSVQVKRGEQPLTPPSETWKFIWH